MSKISCRRFLAVASLALLAGCSTDKAKNCPAITSLVETSIASVFVPNAAPDPSNLLYTIEVTGAHGDCDVDKTAQNSSSELTVSFRATRAPSGSTVTYKVPYYIAISQSERILAKKTYETEVTFAPGEVSKTFTDTVGDIEVAAGKDKKTFDYAILVGLQLTKQQIDYNRASGRLNP